MQTASRRLSRTRLLVAAMTAIAIGSIFAINGLLPNARKAIEASVVGLTAAAETSQPPQLVVTSTRDGGQAQNAGIEVGDAIVEVNHHRFASADAMARFIEDDRQPIMLLGIVHGKKQHQIRFTQEGRPHAR